MNSNYSYGTPGSLPLNLDNHQKIQADVFSNPGHPLAFAVVGNTGTGKTSLAKTILASCVQKGGRAVVFDRYGEYADLSKKLGGRYITVGGDSPCCVTPFSGFNTEIDGTAWIRYVVLEMLRAEPPNDCERTYALDEAIRRASQAVGADTAKLPDLVRSLQHFSSKLSDKLQAVIETNPECFFGEPITFENPLTVINLYPLSNNYAQSGIMMSLLISAFKALALEPCVPKLLFVDQEDFGANSLWREELLTDVHRQTRRHSISMGFALRSFDDLTNSPTIANRLIEAINHLFLLRQAPESIKALASGFFGTFDDLTLTRIANLKTVRGSHADVFTRTLSTDKSYLGRFLASDLWSNT